MCEEGASSEALKEPSLGIRSRRFTGNAVTRYICDSRAESRAGKNQ